jgi:hypothetical protein
MKTIALVLLLGLSGQAAAGYTEAIAALKVEITQPANKELDALLAQPGKALAKDARALALLAENQPALELFRQAAEAPNDGYLLAPKPAKLNSKTPVPNYGAHVRLFKLLLIDAKVKAAQQEAAQSEKDLLAAAGFIVQLSAQKAGVMLSSLVEFLCLEKASPALAESLRNGSVSPAYVKELAARLEKAAVNQDFMRTALLETADTAKGSIEESLNPSTMGEELKKVPLWKRFVVKKLQDKEFFDMVYAQFNSAEDERFKMLIEAFRNNDATPAAAFAKKQQEALAARKQARDKRGQIAQFFDGLKGGPESKKAMAEAMADTMLEIAAPSYEKLIPRYHAFFCELGVLRTAAAIKIYQRAKRRLPENLAQLVPAQLGAEAQDSFNKFAPLAYSRTKKKFMIYSFGPDGKDDKGVPLDLEAYNEKPELNFGDIVFQD